MRILFLSRWFPFPPSNGSKLRIFNLLRGISQSHEISLISFHEPGEERPDSSQLKNFCRNIQYIPGKPFQPHSKRSLFGFFSRKPRSVIDTFSSKMMTLIDNELSRSTYDIVIASQFDMAIYAQHFRSIPAIFEEIEVGAIFEKSSQSKSFLLHFRYELTWRKLSLYLNSLLKLFRACTVVSNNEYQLLKLAVPNYQNIEIIQNFLDLNDYRTDDYHSEEVKQRNHIIFTGSLSFFPNFEAMSWFIQEVFPIILAKLTDTHLTITGNPGQHTLPPHPQVTQVGFVEDVRPYISKAGCSIVPIHSGGGTRLKILEAMALGTPVVSTSKGAEGLDFRNGTHLLIADDPRSFANAVIQMLEDLTLSKQISENAHQMMNTEYSSKVIIPRYLDLIEKTIFCDK